MLANFFDKTKPINSIVLAIVFITFYSIYNFLHNSNSFDDFTIFENFTYFMGSAFFILVARIVFIKNGTSNGNLHNTFLLILLYAMFPVTFEVSKTLAIAFLYLLIYYYISQLKNNSNPQLLLFNSGLLVGGCFLLFNWSILILFFVFLGLFHSKLLNFKNIISPIIGLICPIIIYFTFSFITDNLHPFYQKFEFYYRLSSSAYSISSIKIPLSIITITSTVAIISVFTKVISVSNSYRYQYKLLLTMLFVSVLIILFSPEKNGSEFQYCFVPLAAIHGKFLKSISKNKIKESFLIAFTLISIAVLLSQS